jgi:uncharacterized repeat protein (TIGR01451 family)
VACPAAPVPVGQPLFFSGTVSNSGNATLTNVVVVMNQPSTNTPVFGPITLARGESAVFIASLTAPVDSCQNLLAPIFTARADSGCTGAHVASSFTPQCPVITTPRLSVVKYCPANPVPPGGLLTFSGTVSNSGNVTLTNIFVFNDRPSNNTPVIGPITLAPGAATNFSGSYTVCPECCGPYVDTLTAIGKDRCTGNTVTASGSASCAGSTTPMIAVTKNCPPAPVSIGNPLTFTGSISNSGNVVLNNVIVTDSQAGFIGQIQALAPGEVIGYVASYMPTNCGSNIASTVSVTGINACGGNTITNAVTTTCQVLCVAAQPVTILNPHLQNGQVIFSFLTKTGFTYRVEFTPSLSITTWQLLTNVAGTGSTVQIIDPMNQPQRFYRVLTQ